MAKVGSKLWHLVVITLFIVGAVYVIHMTTNHQGSQILPNLGIGK
jgi:hypothetical protein